MRHSQWNWGISLEEEDKQVGQSFSQSEKPTPFLHLSECFNQKGRSFVYSSKEVFYEKTQSSQVWYGRSRACCAVPMGSTGHGSRPGHGRPARSSYDGGWSWHNASLCVQKAQSNGYPTSTNTRDYGGLSYYRAAAVPTVKNHT